MPLSGRPIRCGLLPSVMLLSAVALACSASAFAAGWTYNQPLHEKKHAAKQQVEALEEQWRVAQLGGDVATMDKLLSDDYIGISVTGQVNTKTQQLDRMRARKVVLTRLDIVERQVKLIGSIAIVTSRAEVEGTNDGVPINGTFRYTRVYQRLPPGIWKITSFEATRVPGQNREREVPTKATASVPPTAPNPQ